MFSSIIFWIRAKNRHGIHSKFVYDFLDQSLYRFSFDGCSNEQKLLRAAILHFKPKNIGVAESGNSLLKSPALEGLNFDLETLPYQFYISGIPNNQLENLILRTSNWTRDAIIFVGGLRNKKEYYEIWKKLCAIPQIHVSVETYHAGLLCFRPKQAPQHFNIRLNSSIFGKK